MSSGRDDVLTATVDIDGAATLFAGLPPAGINFDLIDTPVFKLGASLDLIDVDAGPVLGLTQDFTFTPTLMTTLEFSNPLEIAGMPGLFTSWTGKWSELPDFAILQDTTFTPTFWLDAMLQNDMGLDLGLFGTLDLLKLGATASVGGIDILGLNPLSLNNLLGIDNELFSTDKLGFSVYKDMFALGGFNSFTGPSFTLSISGQTTRISGDLVRIAAVDEPVTTDVPEPGTLLLFATGLLGLAAPQLRRMRRRSAA
jgi:hypothetical protein